jgi:hypothetical protein
MRGLDLIEVAVRAKQAAEKPSSTVILSEAKDLALGIFNLARDSSFAMLRTACGSSE